jgi:hypothetical protein
VCETDLKETLSNKAKLTSKISERKVKEEKPVFLMNIILTFTFKSI